MEPGTKSVPVARVDGVLDGDDAFDSDVWSSAGHSGEPAGAPYVVGTGC